MGDTSSSTDESAGLPTPPEEATPSSRAWTSMADELWRKRSGWGRVGIVTASLLGLAAFVGAVIGIREIESIESRAATFFADTGMSFDYPERWGLSVLDSPSENTFSITPDRASGNWILVSSVPQAEAGGIGMTELTFAAHVASESEIGGWSYTEPEAVEIAGTRGLETDLGGIVGERTGTPLASRWVVLFGADASYLLVVQFDEESRDTMLLAFQALLDSLRLPDVSATSVPAADFVQDRLTAAFTNDEITGQAPWTSRDLEAVITTAPQIHADAVTHLEAITVSFDGEPVTIVGLLNGGNFQGRPDLAEALAELWSDSSPTPVQLGAEIAYRATAKGTEMLLWNDETVTFMAVGGRPAAETAINRVASSSREYLWQAGDCLDLSGTFEEFVIPYAPYGVLALTDCHALHTHEVIHSEVLPEGADAPFSEDLEARRYLMCNEHFVDFTQAANWETRLNLVHYAPVSAEWKRGSRYLACVVSLGDAGGWVEVTGTLRDLGPTYSEVIEVGRCKTEFAIVPCEAPHILEYFAELKRYRAQLPRAEDREDEIREYCDGAFGQRDVAAGPRSVDFGFTVHGPGRYEQGEPALVYCWAFAVPTDDDEGPLDVVGSFFGDWGLAEGGTEAP